MPEEQLSQFMASTATSLMQQQMRQRLVARGQNLNYYAKHACVHACIHSYIHAYIYTHTYIHTYTQPTYKVHIRKRKVRKTIKDRN
jgi:hypothetical protein